MAVRPTGALPRGSRPHGNAGGSRGGQPAGQWKRRSFDPGTSGVERAAAPSRCSGPSSLAEHESAAPFVPNVQLDIETQKDIAKMMVDELDIDSLYRVAEILHARGLLQLEQQPQPPPTPAPPPGSPAAGLEPFGMMPGSFQHMPMHPHRADHHFATAFDHHQQLPFPAEGLGGFPGGMFSHPPFWNPYAPESPAAAFGAASAALASCAASSQDGVHPPPYVGAQAPPPPPAKPLPPPSQQQQVLARQVNLLAELQAEDEREGKRELKPQPTNGAQSEAHNNEGEEEAQDQQQGQATSLIMRNLPLSFDQPTTQRWVDDHGFQDKYDFLLWFPAKKTSRLSNAPYAFINFKTPAFAQAFQKAFHLHRWPDDPATRQPLSIAVAKVQGFVKNFIRFEHLLKDKSPTLCQPFFDPEVVSKLPKETLEAAAAAAKSAPQPENPLEKQATTIIIRNLPANVDSQDMARAWLEARLPDAEENYDFFIYLPAKQRKDEKEAKPAPSPSQGLAYAFVNFKSVGMAHACVKALHNFQPDEDSAPLNVVASRIQGFEELTQHFSSISESGRLKPWIGSSGSSGGGSEGPEEPVLPAQQFQ